MDLALHNKALLMKNVHKFFNKENLPWDNMIQNHYYTIELPGEKMVGSSWWKAYHKLLPDFKRLSSCKASSGEIIKLWFDPWVNRPLAQLFPELFSFKKVKKLLWRTWFSLKIFQITSTPHSLLKLLNILMATKKISSILVYNSLKVGPDSHILFMALEKCKQSQA